MQIAGTSRQDYGRTGPADRVIQPATGYFGPWWSHTCNLSPLGEQYRKREHSEQHRECRRLVEGHASLSRLEGLDQLPSLSWAQLVCDSKGGDGRERRCYSVSREGWCGPGPPVSPFTFQHIRAQPHWVRSRRRSAAPSTSASNATHNACSGAPASKRALLAHRTDTGQPLWAHAAQPRCLDESPLTFCLQAGAGGGG